MLDIKPTIASIPVQSISSSDGKVEFVRFDYLGETDIRQLLQNGNVIFIVAIQGKPLELVNGDEVFPFWKEVKPHLVNEPHEPIYLEDFPEGFAYLASSWIPNNEFELVLLEMHH